MRAEYRTPDLHSHLAVHLILGLEGGVYCDISGEHIEAPGVFIAGDVPHTAYTVSGGMLVYLFDPACRYADWISRNYLAGKQFELLPEKTADEIRSAWNNNASPAQADCEILDILGFPLSDASRMDERIITVLAALRSLEEIPRTLYSGFAARHACRRADCRTYLKKMSGFLCTGTSRGRKCAKAM